MTPRPIDLRCEYLANPLGIGASAPRLSWRLDDSRPGARQSAYQILVAQSLDSLNGNQPDLWDTGQHPSDQSTHIPYAGSALGSRLRAWWKVRTWDASHEPSQWSEPAFFEMGLLNRADWAAQWIGSPELGGPYTPPPSPYLRKTFALNKPIASARLYATALGIYEFHINGQAVSDALFLPGRTEYFKRVQYQTFDVASLLQQKENALGVILGDGWYCGHLHSDPRQYYGDRPRLFAQFIIDFADGSSQTIATDASWKVITGGPIRSSDILMGEDYDARLDVPGWNTTGFDDSAWTNAAIFPDPGISLVAATAPPVRRKNEIKPVAPPTISANKRRWIFDFGQNMVGWVRLKTPAPLNKAGATIDLRHAEMLDKDGKPYTTALRTARAIDHYTLKGSTDENARENYEPRFTWHGFRYVEVRDIPGKPEEDTVTGIVVHSDLPMTGSFECSDKLINQLQSNIVWSQKGNFLEIPTDCPQRDERLGWTGDAQVFIRTAAFNMDVAAFFNKWLAIMADDQGNGADDGKIPSVVPHCPTIWGEGGPAWADAAIICPWTLYLCYGDRRILEDCWPMMDRFLGYLQRTCPALIRPADGAKWKGYGDWLSPPDAITPPEVIGTAFFAHCADLLTKISRILNKGDTTLYSHLAAQIRAKFASRFLASDGSLTTPTQTACVLALHFDLLPENQRAKIFDTLVRDIESRDMHLSTGFVGTPYLNHVLTRFGRVDIAYKLLHQTTYPSWLYPVTLGATTMWERWDGWTPEKGFNDAGMNSYNHYAFGAIGEWMYSGIAGIDLDEANPGYKHILIRPAPPPPGCSPLTSAKAAYDSLHGRIESSWRIDAGQIHLDVTIPANTTATIRIPARGDGPITESDKPTPPICEAAAGVYHFRAPWQ